MSFEINSRLKFAQRILQTEACGKFVYCLEEGVFYKYEKGIWSIIDKVEMSAYISKGLPEFDSCSITVKKDIFEHYKTIYFKHKDDFNWSDMLNLKNGMLNPYDNTKDEHNWIFYSTNQIDYDYIENASCPLWLKTLNEILENDKVKIGILQEFFGYCLTPETKMKKALLLMGETDTGKSTILEILQYMIGTQNYSNVEISNFGNPQYTPQMINKLVNIDSDVDKHATDYEKEFRKITCGEYINSNQKWEKAHTFQPICKIVLAANDFPKITDHSSAFYNRLILIPMNKRFSESEKIIELPELIKKEISGVLNWAIEGLLRLKKRGKFEEHEFIKQAVQELEDENNPCNMFFEEFIEIQMGEYIEKGEIYEKYRRWAEETKNFILSANRFSTVVSKKFHKVTVKNSFDKDGKKRIWKNIVYVPFKIKKEEIAWKENTANELS